MAAQDYIGFEVPLVSALTTVIDRALDDVEGFQIRFGYDEDGDVRWELDHDQDFTVFHESLQGLFEATVDSLAALDGEEE